MGMENKNRADRINYLLKQIDSIKFEIDETVNELYLLHIMLHEKKLELEKLVHPENEAK